MERIGERLRRKREELGLTLEDVSEEIRYRPEVIRAIEEGRTSVFPAKAYLSAFLRAYAAILELDPREIVREQKSEEERAFEAIRNIRVKPKRKRKLPRKVLYILVPLLLAAVLLVVVDRFLWEREPDPGGVARDVPAAPNAHDGLEGTASMDSAAGGVADVEGVGEAGIPGGVPGSAAGESESTGEEPESGAGDSGSVGEGADGGTRESGSTDETAEGGTRESRTAGDEAEGGARESGVSGGETEGGARESGVSGDETEGGARESGISGGETETTAPEPSDEGLDQAGAYLLRQADGTETPDASEEVTEVGADGSPDPDADADSVRGPVESSADGAAVSGTARRHKLVVSARRGAYINLRSGGENVYDGYFGGGEVDSFFSDTEFIIVALTDRGAWTFVQNGERVRLPGSSSEDVSNFVIPVSPDD